MKVTIVKHEIHRVVTRSSMGKEVSIPLDTPGELYTIELSSEDEHQKGVWCETFGNRNDVIRFMRGVEAGRIMTGGMAHLQYEIPP